jgi:hypothetical protein
VTLDSTREQEPLGAIARGLIAVELEFLHQYRRGAGASLDGQQSGGHVVGTSGGLLGHPL